MYSDVISVNDLYMYMHVHACTISSYFLSLYRVIAIVFQKRVVIIDAGSFDNKFVIRSEHFVHSLIWCILL